MFPLSGCNSGLAYPLVNAIVFPPASVTVSLEVEDGVPVALEVEPVIVFVPLNAV